MKKTRLVFLAVMMLIGSIAMAQVRSFMKEYDVEGPLVFTELGHIDPPYTVEVEVERHGMIFFTNIYINGIHVNNDPVRRAQVLSSLQRNQYDQYRLEALALVHQQRRERVDYDQIVIALENYYRSLDVVTEVVVEGREIQVVFDDSSTNHHKVGPWGSSAEDGAQAIKDTIEFFLERNNSLLFTRSGQAANVHPRWRKEFLEELELARSGVRADDHKWRFLVLPGTVNEIHEARERQR